MAKQKVETAKTPESGKSMRSFRGSQELEDLMRFVHENGLRRETHVALDYIAKALKPKKKTRARKSKKVQ